MDTQSPVYDLLLRLKPSETALLDWLVPRLDESHLHTIARADYPFDVEEHFQALKCIHQGQPIPVPLEWIPREVLSLRRWIEPCDPAASDLYSAPQITDDALICAFCCAVLLQAADAPETLDLITSEIATLIQCVSSVRCLGREASESALRFLAWRVSGLSEENEEFPFFSMALLLLYAALFAPDQNGSDLNLLADWVMAKEAQVREDWGDYAPGVPWLFGLTTFTLRQEVWQRQAQVTLLDRAKSFPEPAATKIREIAKHLSG